MMEPAAKDFMCNSFLQVKKEIEKILQIYLADIK